ncbi:hypothetical protein EUX98_g1422 [Antrodiella citrinella]|uniref:Uncharacterized protein n=1 Tax=Antrodiella citrinella TaxID=2447956 RepID=A0A4S4N4G8_9APHY|nr:hypothetical protein EUX98_g1422 [Antrodiella citrinella]
MVGVNPKALDTLNTAYLGLGKKDPGLDVDGRRPLAWRDDLEKLMVGDWEWKEGHIAAVEHAQDTLSLGEGERKGFSYVYNVGQEASRSAGREMMGVGVDDGLTGMDLVLKFNWEHEGAQTRAIAHVPGYTILENVFILNGTFFLVTNSPTSLPPLGSIASATFDPTRPPRPQDWKVINSENAASVLGVYGGRLHGTSWLSTDASDSQDPYTFFSLLRTHNYLLNPRTGKAFTSTSGLRILGPGELPSVSEVTPPIRFMLPFVPTFSSPQLPTPAGGEEVKEHPPLRVKSYNGLHPQFLRAVLPTVTVSYAEDWKDLESMGVPYIFDRLIVADSGAASRGREQWNIGWTPPLRKASIVASSGSELRRRADENLSVEEQELLRRQDETEDSQVGKPVWAAPFVGLSGTEGWWTPVRAALLSYLKLPADPVVEVEAAPAKKRSFWDMKKSQQVVSKPVLTYISMQDEPDNAGSRLRREDHNALLQGLSNLLRDGYLSEVHVVRGNGTSEVWDERMRAIARSSIVIGPFGPQLSDSLLMRVPPLASATPETSTQDDTQPAVREAQPPLLMEFFPPGVFRRDQEYAARSVGLRYMAWWNGRMFSGNSLPPVIGDVNVRVAHLEDSIISLNAELVVKTIQEAASKILLSSV